MRILTERVPSLPLAPLLQALTMSRATYYRDIVCSDKELVADVTDEQTPAEPTELTPDAAGCREAIGPADAAPTEVVDTPSRCRVPGRALSLGEREEVRQLLYGPRFLDSTPTDVFATLLDEGEFYCSIRTMYRLLEHDGANAPRTRARTHIHYERPELLATRPNQLWSWDITKLKGPTTWTYFHLYVIIDVFSRYVVGYMLAHQESKELAKQFIDETLAKQNILPGQLTVHADRGAAMTSKPVALLLSDLGVAKTHSRPHVSNDNPYSESQFKTLKYRPGFPERFGSIEQAREICSELLDWYNNQHHHGGIALLTPAAVHYARAESTIAKRQDLLDAAYRLHPERFVNHPPRHPQLPAAVWINAPAPAPDEGEGQCEAQATAHTSDPACPGGACHGERLSDEPGTGRTGVARSASHLDGDERAI
jgi:putative transposase